MIRVLRFYFCRRCSPLRLLFFAVLLFFLLTVLSITAMQKIQQEHLRQERLRNADQVKRERHSNEEADKGCTDVGNKDIVYSQRTNRDILGEDLFNVRTNDLNDLKKICNVLESCKGFNTNGWLKKSSSPVVQGQTDLYIKEIGLDFSDLHAHEQQIFRRTYEEMTKKLKIYIYDINIGLNMKSPKDPKYAVESLFIELLGQSSYITKDPREATFFFIPSRCTAYASSVSDPEEGRKVAQNTMRDIVLHIRHRYPYWNTNLGSDHFYVCSHDMGAEIAREADPNLMKNSIALVNTADYQDGYFVPHKDISLPPHLGHPPIIVPEVGKGGRDSQSAVRTTLAFFAGNLDRGRVRPAFQKLWSDDPDFKLIVEPLTDESYKHLLLTSKFCLVLRGNRVWSQRLLDAVWFGCIPVIMADYYHLPLQGIVDWNKMAVIIPEAKIADVKSILLSISPQELSRKQAALSQGYSFLSWNVPAKPFDAFHMVLYQLWQKRHLVNY